MHFLLVSTKYMYLIAPCCLHSHTHERHTHLNKIYIIVHIYENNTCYNCTRRTIHAAAPHTILETVGVAVGCFWPHTYTPLRTCRLCHHYSHARHSRSTTTHTYTTTTITTTKQPSVAVNAFLLRSYLSSYNNKK